jgi:hypothetical protein
MLYVLKINKHLRIFQIKLVLKKGLTSVCERICTGSKSKRGEGKLSSYNPEIGSRIFTRRREMTSSRKLGPYNFEDDFFEDFNLMKSMV